jgi:serine/threonine protein kinase
MTRVLSPHFDFDADLNSTFAVCFCFCVDFPLFCAVFFFLLKFKEESVEVMKSVDYVMHRQGSNSSQSSHSSRQIHIIGTPDYIGMPSHSFPLHHVPFISIVSAPEIIEGSPYAQCATVDWWAMGVMMYEFLTGTPPFNAGTREEVFDNVLHKEVPMEWTKVCFLLLGC